jgi:hypothetical protein
MTPKGKRVGRYKARRKHKRREVDESLPFEPPKRFRLDIHIARHDPILQRLPASGHQAIPNPAYTGPEAPQWVAFRLSKAVKEEFLDQLEKGVARLSKYGERHSIRYKAKPIRTSQKHVKLQRQFHDAHDFILENQDNYSVEWTRRRLD